MLLDSDDEHETEAGIPGASFAACALLKFHQAICPIVFSPPPTRAKHPPALSVSPPRGFTQRPPERSPGCPPLDVLRRALCGADEAVDVLEVLGFKHQRRLGARHELRRREADDDVHRLARAAVHRARVRRRAEERARARREDAPVRRKGVERVLDLELVDGDVARGGAQLVGRGRGHGRVEGDCAPLLSVKPLRGHLCELLQMCGEVGLRDLAVPHAVPVHALRHKVARDVDVLPAGWRCAVDDALPLLLVDLVDRALVEPVLELLRAHAIEPARLEVVLGDLLNLLVGVPGRAPKVVLSGRRGARIDRRLDAATADLLRGGRQVRDAAAQRAERGRVVLVLEVSVAVADDAAARVASVKLHVAAAVDEDLDIRLCLVDRSALQLASFALPRILLPRGAARVARGVLIGERDARGAGCDTGRTRSMLPRHGAPAREEGDARPRKEKS
mmetsp:Transcript_19988/g.63793  ORF Transcript_19988/g.63793 Transcript_19988/m.63793 type:complete len:448 (+) Transcript_19988:19-1362(+)